MNASFGELLKQRRQEKELTLREFAARSGMDPGNLSKIERGRLDPPQDPGILERLCAALGYREEDPRAAELRDIAAVQTGRLPYDVLRDREFLSMMPKLLQVLREERAAGTSFGALIQRLHDV